MILPVSVLLTTVLAAVLLMSGIAKVGRGAQTLRMLHDLRMPRAVQRRGIAVAVPVAEIALGGALLVARGATFTVIAVVAVVVFCGFLAITAIVLARRERVVCACFGGTSDRPVDRWSVLRNILLVLTASVVLVTADDGVIAGLLAFDPADWIAYGSGALVVAAGLALVLAARASLAPTSGATNRPAAEESEATPAVGRDGQPWPIPDLEVTNPSGRAVPLTSLATARPTVLLLLSAECTPCALVADRVPQWRAEFQGAVDIAVLTSDSPEAIRGAYPRLGTAVYHGYRSLMAAARIGGVPSALLLGTDRTVAAGPAQGNVEVQDLVRAVVSVIPEPARRRADAVVQLERMETS